MKTLAELTVPLGTKEQRPVGMDYRLELLQRFGNVQMLNMDMINCSTEKRRPYQLAEGVAIINITGVLTNEAYWWDETEYSEIKSEIQFALGDEGAKKILLRVNSPGGQTDGAFETAAFIAEAAKKKPIWAVADVMAYSAAYLLSSQADKIYVAPTSGGVGSIGVYALHMDMSGMLDQMGIKPTFITAGKGKAEGNRFQPLGKDAKERIQADVDRLYGEFIGYVSRGRKMPEEECRALGAYCYHGSKASIGAGLADISGLLEDAWLALATFDESANLVMERLSASKAGTVAQAPAVDHEMTEKGVPMSTTNAAGAGDGTAVKTFTQEEVDRLVKDASAKARGEGAGEVTAIHKEITALCAMASKPAMASDFIKDGLSVAQVREKLSALAVAGDANELDGKLKKGDKDDAAGKEGAITGDMIIKAVDKHIALMGGN